MDVQLQGEDQPLQVTAGHLLWSLDRGGWVQAGQLKQGERLAGENGPIVVESVSADAVPQEVYNLDVETDHRYLVTALCVLVHNVDPSCLGPQWSPKSILDPAYKDGCNAAAAEIQQYVGGRICRITPTRGADFLGAYKGKNWVWNFHVVVVENGIVYDAFTGYEGLPIAEYKALWEYADDLNFGF